MASTAQLDIEPPPDDGVARAAERYPSAWTHFPNEVARDHRVSAGLLVFLAFHATHVGAWVNTSAALQSIVRPTKGRGSGSGSGMGLNSIKIYRRTAQELGYLCRRQIKGTYSGKYQPATERLTLPACGKSGGAGRILQRSWFDGKNSVDELALLIFIRAGAKGGAPYVREIVDRFGWSKPTALKHLKILREQGLISRTDHRQGGRFVGHRYEAVRLAATELAPSRVKMPDHGLPTRLHTFGETLHVLSGKPLRTPSEKVTSRHDETVQCDHLDNCGLDPATDRALAEVRSLGSDQELRNWLIKATEGRVAKALRSSAGIDALCELVARLVGAATPWNFTPAGALVSVLNAVHDRIGSRPSAKLNSVGMIAQRFASEIASGRLSKAPYKADGRPRFALPEGCAWSYDESPPNDDAIAFSPAEAKRAIEELVAIDTKGARALARSLHPRETSLRAFVLEAAEANWLDIDSVLSVMAAVLRRAMVDGTAPGAIKSWGYFAGAVRDEAQSQLAETTGERPGKLDRRANA